MAYAPLVGQDGGSDRVDLPDGSIEMFLRAGLDSFSGMRADLPVGLICRTAQADFVIASGATRPPKHDAYRSAPPVYR
jgi:hypothetical protein